MDSRNKILFLGDAFVGKSTLVNALCGCTDKRPRSTLGGAVKIFAHQFLAGTPNESTELLEFWDVGGSNAHREASRVFLDGANGVVLVHDISNAMSGKNLEFWIESLLHTQTWQRQQGLTASRLMSTSNVSGSDVSFLSAERSFDAGGGIALEIERSSTLPVLVVGTGLDHQQQGADTKKCPHFLQFYEHIALDARKPISYGSTNRILFTSFFDLVVKHAKNAAQPIGRGISSSTHGSNDNPRYPPQMSKTFTTQQRLLPCLSAIRSNEAAIGERRLVPKTATCKFRRIAIKSNPLSGSSGSALVEMGNTRVSCSVTGPRESANESTATEGTLNVSLRGLIDPAFRYSIQHALQAVVCLRKIHNTEVDIELNVISEDGGSLAVCLLAAGAALASANIEMFDVLLACNVLLVPSADATAPLHIYLDPDRATIDAHSGAATELTLAVIRSIGQVVCAELSGGYALPEAQLQNAIPLAFGHCLKLYDIVRASLLKNVAERAL